MTNKEFANTFLKVFAKNISPNKLKKYHVGTKKNQCLWNLFGYELVDCLQGNSARIEYDKVNKADAIEIHYQSDCFGDDTTSILQSCHTNSKDIDDYGEIEFYVVGKDFDWCYVVTHAGNMAGPYFCYKQ